MKLTELESLLEERADLQRLRLLQPPAADENPAMLSVDGDYFPIPTRDAGLIIEGLQTSARVRRLEIESQLEALGIELDDEDDEAEVARG